MKFSCTKENLLRGLNVISRITTKNINLPILNNVLINIQNKNLKLQTTNLEIFITCNIRAKIEDEGIFTMPAKLLNDFVSLLPEERIDLELIDNDLIKIECKNYKTKIKGIGSSEFPLTPQIIEENKFKIKVKDFNKMIEQVIMAVSPNETRPELSGIFVKFNHVENKITAAATDSYRLAEKKIAILESEKAINEKGIIIPSKTMQEVSRIISLLSQIPESPDFMEIVLGENQILFVYDSVEILSRLIEGNYPEYQHIIPGDFKTQIEVNKNELIKAVKVASLFTQSNLNDIHLEISARGGSRPGSGNETGELKVSSAENQLGENTNSLDVEVKGENNSIVLNYRYLIDGLNIMNTEKIKIQMNDDSTPCVIRSVNGEENYMYLVMPIKL